MMVSSRAMRLRGGCLLACGVFLVGFIVAIPALTRIFMDPAFEFALPDDPVEGMLLMAPVGLVLGLGLVAAVAGGWQMVTGRAVRHLPVIFLGIMMAMMAVTGLASLVLGGDAPRSMPPGSILP
jgi:hypothetical protein